ncbi:MAG TPA: hypothetical protein VJ578_04710 [Dehalococcoidia bacterium]|nr:hypothetical protein [Dehalococcoidia bacterium]
MSAPRIYEPQSPLEQQALYRRRAVLQALDAATERPETRPLYRPERRKPLNVDLGWQLARQKGLVALFGFAYDRIFRQLKYPGYMRWTKWQICKRARRR